MNWVFNSRRIRGWLLVLCLSFGPGVAFAAREEIPPLLPPYDELQPTLWERHGLHFVLAGFAVVALGSLVAVWTRRPRPAVQELPAAVARRALESLRGRKEDDALAAEVSRILRRYVMAALALPFAELTTSELRKTLRSHSQISPDLAEGIGDFLRRCDEWKFAPAPPAPQLNAVPTALELVGKIESEANQLSNKDLL